MSIARRVAIIVLSVVTLYAWIAWFTDDPAPPTRPPAPAPYTGVSP